MSKSDPSSFLSNFKIIKQDRDNPKVQKDRKLTWLPSHKKQENLIHKQKRYRGKTRGRWTGRHTKTHTWVFLHHWMRPLRWLSGTTWYVLMESPQSLVSADLMSSSLTMPKTWVLGEEKYRKCVCVCVFL